jgi:transposase
MSGRFWLDDAAWAVLEPLLPRNQPGARRVDDRRVISGILPCCAPAAAGATARPSTAPTRPSTTGSTAGRGAGSDSGCWRP